MNPVLAYNEQTEPDESQWLKQLDEMAKDAKRQLLELSEKEKKQVDQATD